MRAILEHHPKRRYRIVSRLAIRDGAADHPAADVARAGAWSDVGA